MGVMRLGILTGGGDCQGLNAVIRGAVCASVKAPRPVQMLGIRGGFEGLVDDRDHKVLNREDVRGILGRGGTILDTTNRGDPFRYPIRADDGSITYGDVSKRVLANMERHGMDGLIVIGGDGTLAIGHQLAQLGANVIGVPKTIDNDLSATDYTFGFDSAVNVAVEALDRLKTTAESHDRMMIMEVMGRDSGWIALHAGLAGGAHMVLIPEIEYDITKLEAHIRKRQAEGADHHLVVVAEGARPKGGESAHDAAIQASAGALRRLGGACVRVARGLENLGVETRTLVLGHLQRGGSPTYRDRLLGTLFGTRAFDLAFSGQWGRMVCLRGERIEHVPLEDGIAQQKQIDPATDDAVRSARQCGICFGD